MLKGLVAAAIGFMLTWSAPVLDEPTYLLARGNGQLEIVAADGTFTLVKPDDNGHMREVGSGIDLELGFPYMVWSWPALGQSEIAAVWCDEHNAYHTAIPNLYDNAWRRYIKDSYTVSDSILEISACERYGWMEDMNEVLFDAWVSKS